MNKGLLLLLAAAGVVVLTKRKPPRALPPMDGGQGGSLPPPQPGLPTGWQAAGVGFTRTPEGASTGGQGGGFSTGGN